MFRDIRYAVRSLRNSWGFTLAAVTALALGIGATTTIFSVIKPFLSDLTGLTDPDRLVAVRSQNPSRGAETSVVSLPDFADWRRDNRTLRGLTVRQSASFNLAGSDEPLRIAAGLVAADYFSVLGATPLLGRTFAAGEDVPGGPRVVVLAYGLWQRAFGADPDVVGTEITLDGVPAVVVGVMGFDQQERCSELWVPLNIDPASADRGQRSAWVAGRLADDATLEQAQDDLSRIARRLESDFPSTNVGWRVTVVPITEEILSQEATLALALLGAAVLLVLLIACVNVANLLLARAGARRPELALRAALGAGPRRLATQLLTESLVLGLAGGGAGLVVASLGIVLVSGAFPIGNALRHLIVLDTSALGFALVTSLVTALIFGLVPTLRAMRPDLRGTLQDGGRGGDRRLPRLRQTLIAAEVALALVLLILSGLMTRVLITMQSVDPGFDARNLLTARIALPESTYADAQRAVTFFDTLVARTAELPGAISMGVTSRLPIAGSRNNPTRALVIEERPPVRQGESPWAIDLTVDPGFLEALGLPLISGRLMTAADTAAAPPVAVVSQTMAARYWGSEGPVGARIALGDAASGNGWTTVIGIVGDVRNDDIDQPPLPQVYLPMAQHPQRSMALLVRTVGDPSLLADAVRRTVWSLDANQPLSDVRTMDDVLYADTLGSRIVISVLGVFAFLAFSLAAVGIYSVVAYAVSQRTKEVGIRMALGADRRDVVRLIVGQGMMPVAAGMLVGITIAFGVTRLIASLLYQVSPTDPLTFGTVTLLLGATALIASLIPAIRAGRVDPSVTLRQE